MIGFVIDREGVQWSGYLLLEIFHRVLSNFGGVILRVVWWVTCADGKGEVQFW